MHIGILSPNSNVKKFKELTQKAIALDPSNAGIYSVSAVILYNYDYDWKAAEKELLIGLKLNPKNPFLHLIYSKVLKFTGRIEESREQIDEALLLNPVYYGNYVASADYYFHAGDYKKALSEFKKAREILNTETETNWLKFKIHITQKQYDKAIIELQKNYTENESIEIDKIYKEFGIKGVYKWLIKIASKSENYSMPYILAQQYAVIGEHEKALELLEKCFDMRISRLIEIKRDPFFKNLRSASRFKKIVQKIGLDD